MPPHTIEPVDQQLMRKIRILNAASKRFLGVEAVVKIETQKAPGGRFYHAAVFASPTNPSSSPTASPKKMRSPPSKRSSKPTERNHNGQDATPALPDGTTGDDVLD